MAHDLGVSRSRVLPIPRHDPWDCHICRSVGVVLWVNVGIYGSPMECMGYGTSGLDWSTVHAPRPLGGAPLTGQDGYLCQRRERREAHREPTPEDLHTVLLTPEGCGGSGRVRTSLRTMDRRWRWWEEKRRRHRRNGPMSHG